MSAVMLPSGNEDAELHRLTQEGALPQRRVVCRKEKPGLPLCRKVCYAVGGIPYQMTGNALGFFLQIFLLDVVQLEPFHVSLIIFLGRAWDAVTDPAVGFLVSKSPRRKYGKLVPWIACSMPFGVLCYCMMWSTLSDATPTSLKFLWYLLMYSFFQTCMTCHHVPYSSLTMFLGGTQRDRDSATAYRMGMEVFSTLLGSGIQGQIVGSYHARMMNSCYVPNETLPNASTYSLTDSLENIRRAYVFASLVLGSIYCLSCLILIFGVREEPGKVHFDAVWRVPSGSGWRGWGCRGRCEAEGAGHLCGGWFSGCGAQKHNTYLDTETLLSLCWQHPAAAEERGDALEEGRLQLAWEILWGAVGLGRGPQLTASHGAGLANTQPAELRGPARARSAKRQNPAWPLSPLGKVELPFASCLRMIVGHKPYTHLLCGFLFASLAFQITQGIFAFFCTHAAGLAGKFQHLVLIMLVTASLSIPFWQWFLGRFGKKTAASLGLALIIPALVAITQVMHNFLAFVFLVIVAGCSMAVLYLLPWSMLPDTVDDFMLRNPSCLNLEALFYSFYVFFNKFAGGLAVGVSTLSLHFAGYHAGDCTYNHSVILALQLLMAPVPISLLLIAIIIFLLHPIDEERRKQMRMEMEAMGHQVQCGSRE
ncbi:sodium-dependent lysophosphatidylcholine symporter 1-B-like isoform X2 [Aquila chrysaetos chrysaetos]|uniref:sodium-dependent lysophosphatidylcholine symporter 1-B-like isoform X2 n=1 Tax=Aquila chrysaetos chrysaetos TaxID=223781 RepID=UPI001B7D3273|nr:sodium-dependent lysophosphatidylcholine symporter 1-B-like isoform X2 [Aquila chrysaetos chrysaetos]